VRTGIAPTRKPTSILQSGIKGTTILMKKNLKILTATLTSLVLAFVSLGCTPRTGIEVGFRTGATLGRHSIYTGIRSDSNVFALENVALDFYFGWSKWYYDNRSVEFPTRDIISGRFEYVAVAVYFARRQHISWPSNDGVENFRKIENFYFIREISLEMFFTSSYKVSTIGLGRLSQESGLEFAYSERMTIPQHILTTRKGEHFEIHFIVEVIVFDHYELLYVRSQNWHGRFGGVSVFQHYLGNNQVKLI